MAQPLPLPHHTLPLTFGGLPLPLGNLNLQRVCASALSPMLFLLTFPRCLISRKCVLLHCLCSSCSPFVTFSSLDGVCFHSVARVFPTHFSMPFHLQWVSAFTLSPILVPLTCYCLFILQIVCASPPSPVLVLLTLCCLLVFSLCVLPLRHLPLSCSPSLAVSPLVHGYLPSAAYSFCSAFPPISPLLISSWCVPTFHCLSSSCSPSLAVSSLESVCFPSISCADPTHMPLAFLSLVGACFPSIACTCPTH